MQLTDTHLDTSCRNLVYLADSWKWFGRHTGYALVAQDIGGGRTNHVVASSGRSRFSGVSNRMYAYAHGGAWCCAGRDMQSEADFLSRCRENGPALGHVLYFERHHPFFHRWSRAPVEIVTTIHHPPDQMREWHPAVLDDLSRVASAIVLYQRDMDFFEKFVGCGRVRFVHHGVDTEFFRPADAEPDEAHPRLLFVGVNGRNLPMLLRVIGRLSSSHPNLRFDMLVPKITEKPREVLRLASLWRDPRVTWHSGIGDRELVQLYRSSYLLLLPLEHAGVCNGIVEAMACGLPVVTTDVGGVRDYGGGTVYPVVPNGNDRAMADLVADYVASPGWRRQVGSRCRQFAEETLSWQKSRAAHLRAYRELLT